MMMSILIRDSFWPEPGASAARRLSMGMAGGARDPPPEAVGGAPSHAHRQPSSGGGARRRPEGPRDMGALRPVGRSAGHTFHESILIGNLRRLHHAGWVGGIDSRAVAEAPGGGQKDRVTWERYGRSVGRPDTHFTKAY